MPKNWKGGPFEVFQTSILSQNIKKLEEKYLFSEKF